MPIYEFRCNGCDQKFETLCSSTNVGSVTCPKCATNDVSRLFSTFFSSSTSSDGTRTTSSSSRCSGCSGGHCGSCH